MTRRNMLVRADRFICGRTRSPPFFVFLIIAGEKARWRMTGRGAEFAGRLRGCWVGATLELGGGAQNRAIYCPQVRAGPWRTPNQVREFLITEERRQVGCLRTSDPRVCF